jgi:hypothetical protein
MLMQVNTKDIRTSGDLGGRKIAMSLDANSLVHIMGILSDLYSDPAGAVIREYTTNALDSHLAASQSRPVEISTPSRLSPHFVVQDFGVGMSEEDIENIYSQFGNSTKRGNNLEAGMLGLGSKSALTYTEQFNLITVKNGIKLLVSISRSSDGSGGIEIVHSSTTNEPNGVTIKVPVQSDIDAFNNRVRQFVKYVTPGSVLVNGEQPENDLEYVTANIAMIPKNTDRYAQDRIVMGNVSYPTQTRLLDTHAIIYFIKMGEVDFTPSREELMFTELTRRTVERMKTEFNQYFDGHLHRMIDECETIKDAWELQKKYNNDFYNRRLDFRYKGVALPDEHIYVETGGWRNNIDDCKIRNNESYGMSSIDDDQPIIINWTNKKFTRVQARKMHGYFAANGINRSDVILSDVAPYPYLLTENPVYDWNEIKKFGIVKQPKRKKVARTWEGIGGGSDSFSWFVPDATKDIYYASRSLLDNKPTYRNVISDTCQFFWVTKSESERFEKLYPHAKFLGKYFEQLVSDYLNNMTVEDYEFFQYYRASTRNDYLLDWTKIDDPELKKAVRYTAQRTSDPVVERYQNAQAAYTNISWTKQQNFKFPDFTPSDVHDHVFEAYPLLTSCNFYAYNGDSDAIVEHLHRYINQIYAERTTVPAKKVEATV